MIREIIDIRINEPERTNANFRLFIKSILGFLKNCIPDHSPVESEVSPLCL